MKKHNKTNLISKITALFIISLNISCQDKVAVNPVNPVNNTQATPVKTAKPSATPKPKASASVTPEQPDDNEIIGTDTETAKSNINWKEYNPVIKGKKYTYVYTIKEGTETVQADILREITEVDDKIYKFRQSIPTSDSQFRSTEITIQLNNDYSPPIIPPNSVGGASITPLTQVEISEKPEKVKVPLKEFDAIKVTSKSGETITTNWYGKDTGLIKAVQSTKTGTYTLELKEYK